MLFATDIQCHRHIYLFRLAAANPYPTIVKHFQSCIGKETGDNAFANSAAADMVLACVGGGSNAIGMFRVPQHKSPPHRR
jgi:tryptophan synthase beta chain